MDGKLYIQTNGKTTYMNDLSEWKLVIPDSLIGSLLRQAHNTPTSAHLGQAKTLELLQRQFYWSTMARDVRNYIKNCDVCKQMKAPNYITQPEMGKFYAVNRPFQKLFIDFFGAISPKSDR